MIAVQVGASTVPWSIVSSPDQSIVPNNAYGVACVASGDCWAVGSRYNGSVWQTLTEHWNGSTWSIVASPDSGTAGNFLRAITCVTSSDCWAAGLQRDSSANDQTLSEHWDGTAWSVLTVPAPGSAVTASVNGITCVASSDCWAVGGGTNSIGLFTATWHWNGSAWSYDSSGGVGASGLTGVACAASADCWAVGNTSGPGTVATVVEHWNGSAWSKVASPNQGSGSNYLTGVACAASANCWAVGYYASSSTPSRTLAQHWNGSAWSIVASPNQGTSVNYLAAITCVAGADCWAAGIYGNAPGTTRTLAERWNGSAWSIVTSPNQPTNSNQLEGVICAASSDCWTVGYYENGDLTQLTLTEHWNGSTWSAVATPDPGASSNFLSRITCVASSDCWAVGYISASFSTYSLTETLTEHWNGSKWSAVSSPDLGSSYNLLFSVACAASADCWAVGYYKSNSAPLQTLTEHWNGSSWTGVASPNQGTSDNVLSGVVCVTSADCWAVGSYTAAGQTLTEHWDGNSWSIVPSPNQSSSDGLSGVACLADADCWAVGININGSGTRQTLAEHWDGGSWSIVATPNQGTGRNVLNGVACIATSSCWAVGAAAGQTLTEHWNGSVWSIVSSSDQSTSDSLNGIACSGSGNCWAVGSYYNASTVAQTLTEHWNGSAWSIGSSPDQGTKDNFLYGVSCVVNSGCWAAGDYSNGTVYQTLIERYPGPPAAPTGVKAVPGSTTGTTGPLKVSFFPGADNGGPITGYTARCTSSNGGVAGSTTGAASPLTVTGLTTAKTYTCTVKATNAVGTGPASSPSAPVIVGSPAAPTGVKALPGFTSGTTGPLTVTFTPGANNGSDITSYAASCISSNGGVSGSKSGAASPVTVTGLTTAKTYTCSVRAINARGAGPASPPSPAIAVGAPAAPTGVTAVKVASGTLKISFTAAANNGSSVTSYTATCTSSNGGVSGSMSGTASPFTVGGLTAGKTYTCTVRATNTRGTSLPSAPSSAVTA